MEETIDGALAPARQHIDGQRKRRKGVGAASRSSIPVRNLSRHSRSSLAIASHCGGLSGDVGENLIELRQGQSRSCALLIQ